MSKFQISCHVLLLCLPALGWTQQSVSPAAAQEQPKAAPESPTPALTQRLASAPSEAKGRIKLDVVVTDKSGKPVSGLGVEDFALLDNNQPGKILSFQAYDGTVQKAHPPAEVILLIDTVNLDFQAVSNTRQQIESFLLQNGGHLAAPTSIFLLTNDGVSVQPEPSLDGNAMAGELKQVEAKLRTINRSAGAWGAVERFEFSLKMLTAIVDSEGKKPGRKLLIWAGPGWPMLYGPSFNASGKSQRPLFDSIARFSTALRQARIDLYSIALGLPDFSTFLYRDYLKGVRTAEKADNPDLSLKVLAIQSGGRVLSPSNDLTGEIDTCVQDAGVFYTLSFDPPRADRANEYHDLKVTVGKPGLTARTSSGYYNQP
jgi:VWFA-related protein